MFKFVTFWSWDICLLIKPRHELFRNIQKQWLDYDVSHLLAKILEGLKNRKVNSGLQLSYATTEPSSLFVSRYIIYQCL